MMKTNAVTGAISSGSQKDARRRTKLAAGGAFGSRRMSTVILPPSARWRDWFLMALLIAGMTGILPGVLCMALEPVFEAIGWWPVWAALIGFVAAFFRWVWSL